MIFSCIDFVDILHVENLQKLEKYIPIIFSYVLLKFYHLTYTKLSIASLLRDILILVTYKNLGKTKLY